MTTMRINSTQQVRDIHVQMKKAGQGEPLVYLHGAFGYQRWPSFLDRLAESFTVYAPLHPGFGEIDGIDQIDDILDLTLYHLDLLESLGLESPPIVGHFTGAMIAAEMAAVRPASVGKLVLAAPVGLWLDDNPGVDYFAIPADKLSTILFNDPDSAIAMETMPEPGDDEERGIMAIDRVRALSTVGKFLWPIPDKGIKKRLPRIKSETLVVVAENDKIVPPVYGDEFVKRIPNSRLETVQGAGHMFILEQSEIFASIVGKFLTE